MSHALLACFPHPDDETFAVAGTLRHYHRAGTAVALWTATDGEAGSDNGVRGAPGALARTRRVELLRAAGVLGVDRLWAPGFPDGGLAALAPARLRASLHAAFGAVRPQVVITFGPEGAPTGHADHQALSRAVTALVADLQRAGAPEAPARLYYCTWTPAEDAPTHRPSGAPRVAPATPVTCRVDVRDALAVKRAAFEAHRSQHHHRAEFERDVLGPVEEYGLAAGLPGTVPQPAPLTDDLFAGL
ncbi:MAG TPA: PIG-L family deacetylase [Gemmatimonadales bacterium]|nr:PIG-L family deacetylase [Gemmatimonadales bacterium]